MRNSDPILEEIWKARDEHARRFNYDLKKICADLRKIEKQSGRRVVVRKPKRCSTTTEEQGPQRRLEGKRCEKG
jgi:hypothetical protein